MSERPGYASARGHGRPLGRATLLIETGSIHRGRSVRENHQANLSVIITRILRKHGDPPDNQEYATETVLEHAETLSRE